MSRIDADSAEALFHRWTREPGGSGAPLLEELCTRYPRHAEAFRRLHADWERGRGLIEQLGPSPTTGDGVPIQLPPSDAGSLEPRPNADRYAFEEVVGRGGMGIVLRVRDRELDRPLAMKVARTGELDGPSGAQRAERLRVEARTQASLEHPGILPVHELGLGPAGEMYFTMPLVRGRGLDEILEDIRAGNEAWSLSRIVGVLLRVCEAVSSAHHRGVVHRDLKPSNVMVGEFGETYVTDWGLARVAGLPDARDLRPAEPGSEDSPILTLEGDVIGTPAYMPPEQAQGRAEEIDERADIYSIGAMLYELLAGERPYGDAPPRRVLAAVRAGPPAPLGRLARRAPEELVAICERAMARERGDRYPSVLELREDLERWLEGRVVRAHATGALAELRKWVGRNRIAATAVALTLTAAIGGLALHTRAVARAADELAASLYRTDVALADAAIASGDTGPLLELLGRAPQERRGWEWRYLARLADTSRLVLRADGASLHSVAISPDGALVAAGDERGTVSTWTLPDGELVARFGPLRGPVRRLGFAPDLRTLGACGDDRVLRLNDARTGASLGPAAAADTSYLTLDFDLSVGLAAACRLDGQVEVEAATGGGAVTILRGAHRDGVEQVAFTPDGRAALTASRDGRVAFWSLAEAECRWSVEAHAAWVRSLALDPAAERVASGANDGTIAVRSVADGGLVAELPPHRGGVFALAWSPDGRRLATAGGPCVYVWDTASWRELARLVGQDSRVCGLAFTPDGRALASIGLNGELRISDLEPLLARGRLPDPGGDVRALAMRNGGDLVVSGGEYGRVAIRRFDDGRELARRDAGVGLVRDLCVSPDGETLAVTGSVRRVNLLSADDLGLIGGFGLDGVGARVAYLSESRLLVADRGGMLSLRSLPSGGIEWQRRVARLYVVDLALDVARDRVVVAAADGTVMLCRASTGEVLAETQAGETGELALALSPDGRRAAVGGRRNLQLLLLPSLRLERRVDSMEHARPLVWSPDGERLFGGGVDGSLTLWDPRTGARIAGFAAHLEACSALAISADGNRLATGACDDSVRLWDARPLELTRPRSSPPR